MTGQRITKRTLDSLKPLSTEFTLWDSAVSGFGIRVRPTGAMSYVVVYRAGSGRGAPVRRYTIATAGKITAERARARAKAILGSVAHGNDPAGQKSTERGVPTVAELADRFMAEHIDPKRKSGTAKFYRDILERLVKPAIGTTKADKLTRLQVVKLHSSLSGTPFQANRVLAVVGSMYAFAVRAGGRGRRYKASGRDR
jgi:Arm DNA-binding domain